MPLKITAVPSPDAKANASGAVKAPSNSFASVLVRTTASQQSNAQVAKPNSAAPRPSGGATVQAAIKDAQPDPTELISPLLQNVVTSHAPAAKLESDTSGAADALGEEDD